MFCLHDKWIPNTKHLLCVQRLSASMTKKMKQNKTEVKRKPPYEFKTDSMFLNKRCLCLASKIKLNSSTLSPTSKESSRLSTEGQIQRQRKSPYQCPPPTTPTPKKKLGLNLSSPTSFLLEIYLIQMTERLLRTHTRANPYCNTALKTTNYTSKILSQL